MKRCVIWAVLGLALSSGCDGDGIECKDGTRKCENNWAHTCVLGEWRSIYCEGNAPICDEKQGCMRASTGMCGNGHIDLGEDCDGDAPHGKTCADLNDKLTGIPECHECKLNYQVCQTNTCSEGDKRCDGDVLQFCSSNQWNPVQDCHEDGLVCDRDGKKCVKGQ